MRDGLRQLEQGGYDEPLLVKSIDWSLNLASREVVVSKLESRRLLLEDVESPTTGYWLWREVALVTLAARFFVTAYSFFDGWQDETVDKRASGAPYVSRGPVCCILLTTVRMCWR